MLEPRRLATRAAARRMAALLGTEVGGLVGYQTRDERRIGRDTRIEVVTEGVLTRRLQHDPELPGVGLVIFDEVHERNLPTDLGLAFALDARDNVRPDLRAAGDVGDARRRQAQRSPRRRADRSRASAARFDVDVRWLPLTKGTRVEQATGDAVLRALDGGGRRRARLPARHRRDPPCRAVPGRSGRARRSTCACWPARCRWPSRTWPCRRRRAGGGGSC